MKFDKGRTVTWLLLLFILIVLFNIYTLIKERDQIYKSLESTIFNKVISNIPEPKNGIDGDTPVKGIDYFDGRDGRDGENGKDGQDGRDGVDGAQGPQGIQGEKGEPGANGLTPQLRCNKEKNRWEVRYSDDQNWELLNGEKVRCTNGL
jgi:hypothetical protein